MLNRLLRIAGARRGGGRAGPPRLDALLEHHPDGLVVLGGDWRIRFANAAAEEILGADGGWIGRSLLQALEPCGGVLVSDGPACDVQLPRPDGSTVVAEVRVTDRLDDHEVGGFIVSLRDVTERRRVEDQLRRQVLADPLTGVGNRLLFEDRLRHAVKALARSDEPLAVLFVDLDDFKGVNDRYGHGAGDQVLVEVARRIRAAVRPADTVARVGGDEFVVLAEAIDHVGVGEAIAERIEEAIAEPFIIGGEPVRIGASVGVACSPEVGCLDELVHVADADMYRQKTAPRLLRHG